MKWREGTGENYLWTYGHPGTGKSVLAKHVFEILTEEHRRKPSSKHQSGSKSAVLACYFFCFEGDDRAKSPRGLVASIIHQLLFQDPALAKALKKTYQTITHRETESLWVLWDILSLILNGLGDRRLFIVIDALDEMDKNQRKAFLQRLRQVVDPDMRNVRIFLTSRKESDLEKIFDTWAITSVEFGTNSRGNASDLSSYLKGTIREYATENHFDKKTANLIYRQISSRADGMFMWAVLAWDNFTDGVGLWTRDLIRERLADLQRLPPGMEHLYHHLLIGVDKRMRPALTHLLQWVIAARRPLSTTELSLALALTERPQSSADIKKRLSIRAFVKRACPHLLQINDEGIVTIIHQSFKDFLLGVDQVNGEPNIFFLNLKSIDLQIAKGCAVYIGLSDIGLQRDGPWVAENLEWSEKEGEAQWARLAKLNANYPFLEYSVDWWAFHLKGQDDDSEFYQLFKRVISQKRNLQLLHNLDSPHRFRMGIKKPPIWVAFNHGLYDLIEHLVKDGHNINESFDRFDMIHQFGFTEIVDHWAHFPTEEKHPRNWQVLQKLLSLGLDINGTDTYGRTILLSLVMQAHDSRAIEYCSHMNIEVNAPDEGSTTAVRMFSSLSNVDINAKDRSGTTALHAATRHVSSVAKVLIQTLLTHPDIDVNSEDSHGRTPLNVAIHWGKPRTAMLLLETPGVKIDTSSTIQGESPLINATRQGWADVVVAMLDHLTSDEIQKHLDLHHRNVLHWTITGGMIDASLVAIRSSPPTVTAADTRGITPLHLAAQFGQGQILKALLEHGASPTQKTRFGETPLHMAAAAGHMKVLKRLIKSLPTPSEINMRDTMGWTVTHRAVTSGNEDLQRFLVSLPDVDLKKSDRHGRTPVAFAASLASLNTLQIFLQARPEDIGFIDEFGNTLLHLAARENNEFTIPFLLQEIGRKGNAINDWGKTALDMLPMESPWRAKFILSGLVHSDDFFDRKPHCCFTGGRPTRPHLRFHYDWKIAKNPKWY